MQLTVYWHQNCMFEQKDISEETLRYVPGSICHWEQIKMYYSVEGNSMETRYVGFLQYVDFA